MSAASSRRIGRACSEEVQALKVGLDFRRPEYRREVFLRFYEFHLEYKSHPGCVYFAMPWLAKKHKLDEEAKLWLAFINGNTQNIVTSWIIFKRFPTVNAKGLAAWFNKTYEGLAWDTDRRYHKKDFIKSVERYAELVGRSQKKYFQSLEGPTGIATFDKVWEALRADFYTFGRLSSFSYSEYLRIMGVPLNCGTLFLEDMEGSKSHRNGLAKVLGRDDMDWFRETDFKGDYTAEELGWLETEAAQLLKEAQKRTAKNKAVDPREVHYFTMESALCTFKSWHRKNRRYANCYVDMFLERIQKAECNFGVEEVAQFWDCRQECLPEHLLLECNPNDPGLVPEKQNHYRETGEVIMMSKKWSEFDNSFDRRIWAKSLFL